jgi:hypothetical protein
MNVMATRDAIVVCCGRVDACVRAVFEKHEGTVERLTALSCAISLDCDVHSAIAAHVCLNGRLFQREALIAFDWSNDQMVQTRPKHPCAIDSNHSSVDNAMADGILNGQRFLNDATFRDVCKCADGDMKSWTIPVHPNRHNLIGSIGSN